MKQLKSFVLFCLRSDGSARTECVSELKCVLVMGKVGKNPESTLIQFLKFRNQFWKVGPPRIIWSSLKSSGAVRNWGHPELFRVIWSRPESSRVVQSFSEFPESPEIEVVWSRPESSGVVCSLESHLKSSGVVWSLRSCPELEPFGVVRSHSKSFRVFGVSQNWSRAESSGVIWSRPESSDII